MPFTQRRNNLLLDAAAISWSVSNGDKWEAQGMVATHWREKRAPLDNLARVLGKPKWRVVFTGLVILGGGILSAQTHGGQISGLRANIV